MVAGPAAHRQDEHEVPVIPLGVPNAKGRSIAGVFSQVVGLAECLDQVVERARGRSEKHDGVEVVAFRRSLGRGRRGGHQEDRQDEADQRCAMEMWHEGARSSWGVGDERPRRTAS